MYAEVAARARRTIQDDDGADRALDVWYMDDGQVLIRSECLESYLRALDEAAVLVDATRDRGNNVKSIARVLGRPEGCEACGNDWATWYVEDSCKLPGPNTPYKVLGVKGGSDDVSTT